MMVEFTMRRAIAAPPERVFALASAFADLPRFMPGIRRIEVVTPGPIGTGTRFRETRLMFGKEATAEMTVAEFTPPRGYVLVCEEHGCRYRHELRVLPAADGNTAVELTFAAVPFRFVAKVFTVLMRPLLKLCAKEGAKDLDALAAEAERQPHASTGAAAAASAV